VAARSRQSQKQILETLGRELTLILQGKPPSPDNLVNPEVVDG
jgi:hypothetical protein